jgi:glycerol-3-phosphate acyltransferase PlsY
MPINLIVIVVSYLLGSIPTAVIVSRWRHGVDIREMGDGNMGARNTYRTLGHRLGVIVALADILKGVFSILLAKRFGLDPTWQCAAGAAAILGHDFPIFARFRGGQGLATTFGTMIVLFPQNALIGFAIFVFAFLIFRNMDISAAVGFGTIAFSLWRMGLLLLLFYTVTTLLFIPVKKFMDSHRLPETEPDCLPPSPN